MEEGRLCEADDMQWCTIDEPWFSGDCRVGPCRLAFLDESGKHGTQKASIICRVLRTID